MTIVSAVVAIIWTIFSTPLLASSERNPRFSDYPAGIMTGRKAPLHLTRDDQMFRSRIRDLYQAGLRYGPNFAGHYVVTDVGCGTFCTFLLVIDLRTGRTVNFDVPSGEDLYVCDDNYVDQEGGYPGEIGKKFYFEPDSHLFVVTGKMPGNECGARYFVEDNGKMTQVRDVHLQATR